MSAENGMWYQSESKFPIPLLSAFLVSKPQWAKSSATTPSPTRSASEATGGGGGLAPAAPRGPKQDPPPPQARATRESPPRDRPPAPHRPLQHLMRCTSN